MTPHDFEDEYLPEEESTLERLLGPSSMALSVVALILGIMAMMITYEETDINVDIGHGLVMPPDKPEKEPDKPVEPTEIKIPEITQTAAILPPAEITEPQIDVIQEALLTPSVDLDNSIETFNTPSKLARVIGVGGPTGKAGRLGRLGGNKTGGDGGDSAKAHKGVKGGLEWLRRHQNPNGLWELDNFDRQCGREGKKGKCDGHGLAEHTTGGSALALLAYTGYGFTHIDDGQHPKPAQQKIYAPVVAKASKALRKLQRPDGRFGNDDGTLMYNQALATLALADLFAQSKDDTLAESVSRATTWILESQNPISEGGAWRYANYKAHPELKAEHSAETGGGTNDTSVTTWMVMALKTAEKGGLTVTPESYQGASHWLDSVYAGNGYDDPGTFGYTKKKGFIHLRPYGTTACGMLSRQFMGQNSGIAGGTKTLMKELPERDGIRDMYYWYYGSLALYQVGGDTWEKWNDAMQPTLTKTQNGRKMKASCLHGSWNPGSTSWGADYGGRVYTTAMGALTLQVYYRYEKMKKTTNE